MWRFATWPPCSHQHLDLTRNKIYFIALHDLKVSFHQNIEQHSLGPALYYVFPILPWPGSDYCQPFVWNWVLIELNQSIKSKYSMPGSVVPLALCLHQFLKVKILILPKKTNLLFEENSSFNRDPEIEHEGGQFNVFYFVRNTIQTFDKTKFKFCKPAPTPFRKIWKAFRSPFSDKVKRYSWISLGDVYVYMIYMAKDCGFVAKQKLSGYFVFSSSLAKIQGPARNIGLNWMYDLTNILTSNRWCALSSFLVDDFFRDSCIVNAGFCNFYKKYD